MRRSAKIVAAITVFALALLACALTFRPGMVSEAKRKTVVVELFTSEGCSSCPPADLLLAKLQQRDEQNRVEIIPLGFHVDYWDHLGWQDRFSSSAYTQRQEQYAHRFSLDGPYTPQMVVDGESEFVGSDSWRAREVIAQEAAQAAQADVQLSFSRPDKLLVRVHSSDMAGEIRFAITEDNLSSNVGAGENDGHVLRHTAVVRDFRTLGKLTQGSFQTEISIPPNKDWKPQDLRYVVFVQETANRRIQGAASLSGAR